MLKIIPACVAILLLVTSNVIGDSIDNWTPSHGFSEKIYTGENLRVVLEDISTLSGYQILLPESLLSIEVHGTFRPDHVDRFLSRILKNYNHSFTVNESEKIFVVRIFGEKVGKSVIVAGNLDGEKIDFFTGLTKEELDSLHEERRLRLSKVGAIDSFTGLPVAEVEQMLRDQKEKYSAPGSIDTFTGMTRQDIDELHRIRAVELTKPDAIDHFTGLTHADIEEMHARRRDERSNPNYIDPFTGMKLSEIEEMQRRALR